MPSKEIEQLLADVDKKFGKETLKFYGNSKLAIDVISTGSLSLDKALGTGGLPKGRIVEIYGPESAGKTTLTLHMLAEAQKLGKQVAFIDVEHALNPSYAEQLGVDMSKVLYAQPDSGEQALELVEALIRSGEVAVVVVDSVAALTPRAELDGEMGDSLPGRHARLMGQALRKLTHVTSKTGCILIFINQLREKIGVMFGSPETTPGGKGLKFFATIRLDIRKIGDIKEGDVRVGNRTRIKVVKNKLATPHKEVELDLIYGEGLSREADVIDLAVLDNILKKSGAWFSYNDKNIAQGKPNLIKLLKSEPKLMKEIEVALNSKPIDKVIAIL